MTTLQISTCATQENELLESAFLEYENILDINCISCETPVELFASICGTYDEVHAELKECRTQIGDLQVEVGLLKEELKNFKLQQAHDKYLEEYSIVCSDSKQIIDDSVWRICKPQLPRWMVKSLFLESIKDGDTASIQILNHALSVIRFSQLE